jgi:hypothetical protein
MSVIQEVINRIKSGKPPSNTAKQRKRDEIDRFIIKTLNGKLKDVLPVSVRQVFYAAVAANVVDKKNGATLIYDRLAFLRVQGDIPFEWIVDNSRRFQPSYQNTTIEDASATLRGYIESAYSPKLNKQTGQEIAQVVWTEASGTVSQLERVARQFDIPVVSGQGFTSLSQAYYVAQDWMKLLDSLKTNKLRVIYAGDYDPSGVIIPHDVRLHLMYHFISAGKKIDFEMDRIALTEKMIVENNIITQPVEMSTMKSASIRWKGVNGNRRESAQLEAIPPQDLQKLLKHEIEKVYEADKFQPYQQDYEKECEKLKTMRDEILSKM